MTYIHLFPDIQSPGYSIISEVRCTTWTKQLCLQHLQVLAMITPLHNERRCCIHRLQKFWRLFNCKISRMPVYITFGKQSENKKSITDGGCCVICQCSSYVHSIIIMGQKTIKTSKIQRRRSSHYLCLLPFFSIKHYLRRPKLKLPLMTTVFWAMQSCRLVQI
jgi:hypothetical protein